MVYGSEYSSKVVGVHRALTAQIGLQIGHQQGARHSFTGNVSHHQRQTPLPKLKKVVVVTTDCTSGDAAARILQRLHGRHFLRKEPRLHLPGNLHFTGHATLNLHLLGHLFCEAYIFKSDAYLACYGIEKRLVLAGVGFFGTPLAKNQQADQPASATKDRHETFRSKRPGIASCGGILWDIPGFSALGDLHNQWKRAWNCLQLLRNKQRAKAEGELRSW